MFAVPLDCILFAYFKIYCLRVWVLVSLNLGAEVFSSETLNSLGTPLTMGWWWWLFSCSVVSDSLPSRGLQHARLPCPSPSPRVYSNSHPLSRWCHPMSSLFFYLWSYPASGFFQMSQLFASSGQRIGASASASVLPVNIQDTFPLEWTGWTSWQSKGLSRVFSSTTVQNHQFFGAQLSL